MPFLNPWGLLWGLSLPGILLLYFLRQQHREQVVPSTYLWARALQELEAARPWQKLRKNLLMLLQLLAALLFALALARPYTPAATAGEWVAVLDISASMQATDVSPSRFDHAVKELEKMVDGLSPGSAMTVITAGPRAAVRIGRSTDKAALKSAIGNIAAENGTAALEDALSLARALTREMPDANIVLLSDQKAGAEDIVWVDCSGDGANTAVLPLSYERREGKLTVLSPIANHGPERTVTLECRVDGALADARDITLGADATQPVYWDDLPGDASNVQVRIIDSQDALALDDMGYAAIQPEQTLRVLLVTKGNRFLEAALSLREGVVIEKTPPADILPSQGYDLYIYEQVLPDPMPADGALLFIAPSKLPQGLRGEITEVNGGALLTAAGREQDMLLQNVTPSDVRVAASAAYQNVTGMLPLMRLGEDAVVLSGEWERRPTLLIGFDLHESNWPLKKDFPIFIQNLLAWAVPGTAQGVIGGASGQSMVLTPLPQATQMQVKTPSGQVVQLMPPFPAEVFSQTQELGIYTLTQTLPEGEVQTHFAIHLSPAESDLSAKVVRAGEAAGQAAHAPRGAKEYAPILLMLVLAVLLIEWGVNGRGH